MMNSIFDACDTSMKISFDSFKETLFRLAAFLILKCLNGATVTVSRLLTFS